MSSYDLYTDFEIVDLLNQNDESAFRHLYNKYWDKLFIMASNRLDDPTEGEEVVQDIFFNLWKKRETFRLQRGFENYFAVALKYEVITRRAKRLKNKAFQTQLYSALNEPYIEEAFHQFDLDQLQSQLKYRINQLPKKCQLVFTLSRESELSNKQIAEKLNISEKTVEKHITHALKFLKTHFGHYFNLILLLLISL
ncbi:MAG TPA: RNA polymerase sigma-70 factor [Flavobacteriaceae bacterium]|nr:RNA polymerase sigma-70 factor [Flavobacteriaceae bacterium]